MIGPQTAALAISVARGLVQFGKRLDQLWMEKTAEREMILLHPPTRRLASLKDVVAELRQLVSEGTRGTGSVARSDLREIRQILDANVPMGPATTRAYELFGKYFPEQAEVEVFHPDRAFLGRLRKLKPDLDWDNPDIQAAFLTISAGKRDGEIGYAGRVGLLVAESDKLKRDAQAMTLTLQPATDDENL